LIEENSTAKNFSSKGVGREEKKGREKKVKILAVNL